MKEDGLFGGEWTPVAKGSGSYIRIQTFQHVGRGQGDYDACLRRKSWGGFFFLKSNMALETVGLVQMSFRGPASWQAAMLISGRITTDAHTPPSHGEIAPLR